MQLSSFNFRPLFVISLSLSLLLTTLTAEAGFKDKLMKLATKTVRLVPVTDWQQIPENVSLEIKMQNDAEDADEFVKAFRKHADKALSELDVKLADNADIKLVFDLGEFSKGTQWKKLVGGVWGRGHIFGKLMILDKGQSVGEFDFSSKLRGGFTASSVSAMAKEVAPPLIYKLLKGDRDSELHKSS
jgi:hypothetical protein